MLLQVTEGIDSTYAAVKSSITNASSRRTGRRRLPRPFTGDILSHPSPFIYHCWRTTRHYFSYSGDRILRPFNLHSALGQTLLYETGMPQAPTLVPAALQRLGGGGGSGAKHGTGTVSSSAEVFPFRHDAYEQHFVMKAPKVSSKVVMDIVAS